MSNSRSLFAWQAKYHSLTRREQSAIIVGLMAVLAFFLVQFAYIPLSHRLDRLESAIKSKENDLSKLTNIVAQYKRLESNEEGMKGKARDDAFNLFSVLEKLATHSGLMDKIDYMRPGSLQLDSLRNEEWVEVKLSQINMKEFTEFLHNLHTFGKGIYIKRLSARKDGEYLNLILQPAIIEIRK